MSGVFGGKMWIFLIAVHLYLPTTAFCYTYRDMENILTTGTNIKTLEENFYPVNAHRKNIVSISYKFIFPENWNNVDYWSNNSSGICFYWLSSPVHLTINKELLHGLSLRSYIPEVSYTSLLFNLSNLTRSDLLSITRDLEQIYDLHGNDIDALCQGEDVLDFLNNFTANAHMYALGKKKIFDQEIRPDDRGYSIYYYIPNTPSKYCVLHHEHSYISQRYLLNVGSLLLVIFSVLGFPLLFVGLYKPVVNKLNGPSGSDYWRFIAWSVVFVSFFVNCLIIVNNAIILKEIIGQYDSSLDIFIFTLVFSVFCFGVWILDFFGCTFAIAYMHFYKEDFPKNFPTPILLTKLLEKFQCCCCNGGPDEGAGDNENGGDNERNRKNNKCCPKCIAIALGYTIFVHFLQLTSFHVVYIMLGAIAAPSETLSVFCSFITTYIFAVIYVAVIFKYLSIEHFKDRVTWNFIFCIIPLSIAGIALIGSVALFTAFFYRFSVVMEITSRSEGLWGLVKSFLPTLLVAFLGFCGHKLLKYIKKRTPTHDREVQTPPENGIESSLSSRSVGTQDEPQTPCESSQGSHMAGTAGNRSSQDGEATNIEEDHSFQSKETEHFLT